jgi:hypothetical protein
VLLRERGYLAMGGQIVGAIVIEARRPRLTGGEKATLRGGKTPSNWSKARVEAVHRGFLFQHLYAVRALLLASRRLLCVVVETDEDVELKALGRRIDVQVKHRVDALAFGEIESALARFADLRVAHAPDGREGMAEFVIATKFEPDESLLARMAASDWPADVRVMWPDAAESVD